MPKVRALKKKILANLALAILGRPVLEKTLVTLCAKPFIRNTFKLRAIALIYPFVLDRPVFRIADMGQYKLWVNIADYMGMYLYFFKEHSEPFATSLAWQLVSAGDVCFDVGANLGSYAFLMANRIAGRGQVYAFEPQPDLYQMILRTKALNPGGDGVIADRRAAYSASGETLKFYTPPDPHISSAVASLVNYGSFLSGDHYFSVETIALDDYFHDAAIGRCKLMKIDVERAELEVLRGMMRILRGRRVDYLIVEQTAGSESQQLLGAAGYRCWLIDEGRKVLVDGQWVSGGHFGNYLFVSPDRVELFKDHFAPILAEPPVTPIARQTVSHRNSTAEDAENAENAEIPTPFSPHPCDLCGEFDTRG